MYSESRSKYLRKLLELKREMDEEYRAHKLDSECTELRFVLGYILVAFWFFQMDQLWTHLLSWRLQLTSGIVVEDTAELVQNQLISEMAEQAAAEMEAEAAEANAGA